MTRPLAIIYVGVLPPHPGGSAISCAEILLEIARLGHSVRAISPATTQSTSGGDKFAHTHPEIGVVRYEVPHFYHDPSVAQSHEDAEVEASWVGAALVASITEKRPDVVLIGRESFLCSVAPVAFQYGLPSVLRVAGSQLHAIAAGKFPLEFCREFRSNLGKVDVVVTQASHMIRPLEALGCRSTKIIPNAVDLRRFWPRPADTGLARELNLPRNAKVVLHASNMKNLKRPLDIVFSAADAVRQAGDLYYVVAGDGPMLGKMQQLCREKGLWQRFRFTGWLDYDRMPGYMNLADVVVMPSGAEQQAGVYLEAQASGRLLLASDIPGAREVVEDGRTGILFRVGDIADLTRKTILAVNDPKLRRAIGKQSRERVRRHDLRIIVREHANTLCEASEPAALRREF